MRIYGGMSNLGNMFNIATVLIFVDNELFPMKTIHPHGLKFAYDWANIIMIVYR